MSLKEKVLRYRILHKITQKQFANLVGMSHVLIVKLENDKSISGLSEEKIKMFLEKEVW